LLGILLVFTVDELQLFGFCGVVLVLGNVSLIVHLVENGLLPLFVILNAVKRVVICRQVGDAGNGGALRQVQILHVFAEVGLGRRLHSIAALAEIHHVEIPFYDLFLGVFFLQLQSLEYLQQLALHGNIVLLCKVFDKLLGYGGAAEVVVHTEEHVDKRVRGTEPVHALVLVEALVLYGYHGMFHVFGYLVIVDPDALFAAGQSDKILPGTVFVLIEDGTGLIQRKLGQRKINAWRQRSFNIVGKNARKQQHRQNNDKKNGAYYLEYRADRAAYGLRRDVCRAGRGDFSVFAHMGCNTSRRVDDYILNQHCIILCQILKYYL